MDIEEVLSRYAFQVKPQFEEADDHTWKAWYPDADWSVTADSKEAALDKVRDEYARRMNTGDDPQPRSAEIYEQHLKSPVPGVYAMDAELFRHLRALGEAPLSRASLDRAFEEAERRRALGQAYTKADYLAEHPDSQGDRR